MKRLIILFLAAGMLAPLTALASQRSQTRQRAQTHEPTRRDQRGVIRVTVVVTPSQPSQRTLDKPRLTSAPQSALARLSEGLAASADVAGSGGKTPQGAITRLAARESSIVARLAKEEEAARLRALAD